MTFNSLSFKVRLVGSEHTLYQGQVEVLFNGVWAGICQNYNWDFPEANVACRQLGYHGAVQPTYHGPSAIGIDDVRLTNVHCLGNETSILNCTHDLFGVGRNCRSGEVGVRCSPSGEDIRNFKGLFVYVFLCFFFFNGNRLFLVLVQQPSSFCLFLLLFRLCLRIALFWFEHLNRPVVCSAK